MMRTNNENWELTILDGCAPSKEFGSLMASDIDNDGHVEVVIGGVPGLFIYRPDTFERFIVAQNRFHVGGTLEDMDGDGRPEIYVGEARHPDAEEWMITCYRQTGAVGDPWERIVIDDQFEGGPHDVIFADIDGDGENELVTIACYTEVSGIYAYKKTGDLSSPWKKHTIQEGIFTEGLSAGDLDGDGKVEIVCGPDWYKAPKAGAFSGRWTRRTYALRFREMCRTALLDITGNGRPDIVIVDSEYDDGILSWFENHLAENPGQPWVEHTIDIPIVYGHSISVWNDAEGSHVFVGEMEQGGWSPTYNFDARVLVYSSADHGATWARAVLHTGEGTHQAVMYDVDGDGELEVVGKTAGGRWRNPKVQVFKNVRTRSPIESYKHSFIDRDKPHTATDILAADVNGDGSSDILCGSFWYRSPDWERYCIPDAYQVINAFDIDGDGRQEIIATRKKLGQNHWYDEISCDLCWLKPIHPEAGVWEEYSIGEGSGDWPHGSVIAPLLPGGKLAMVLGYHNASDNVYPELFEIPEDLKSPWPKRVIAEIPYGEELLACDLDGDGRLDIVAGCYWLENLGDGSFRPYRIAVGFQPARAAIMDVNGDGRTDIVLGEEVLDFQKRVTPFSKVVWLENPGDPRNVPWPMHVIDTVRCAHSVGAADLDGDGELEIIIGEHDPFSPYRSRCRLMAYKKAEPLGRAWKRYVIDSRFEHHDGTKVIEAGPGNPGIISHGWQESKYVHLWTKD